jgi:epoxyqueuosine reductase QueG
MVDRDDGLSSNWSQRHVAFAAGLGTFGLSDGFITEKGMALRCGSVVTDAALASTERKHDGPYGNCLFYRGVPCMKCAERCPADAITAEGHDKKRCMMFVLVEQKEILAELGRADGYIGDYVGCGLCQTRVPCEHGIPEVKRG